MADRVSQWEPQPAAGPEPVAGPDLRREQRAARLESGRGETGRHAGEPRVPCPQAGLPARPAALAQEQEQPRAAEALRREVLPAVPPAARVRSGVQAPYVAQAGRRAEPARVAGVRRAAERHSAPSARRAQARWPARVGLGPPQVGQDARDRRPAGAVASGEQRARHWRAAPEPGAGPFAPEPARRAQGSAARGAVLARRQAVRPGAAQPGRVAAQPGQVAAQPGLAQGDAEQRAERRTGPVAQPGAGPPEAHRLRARPAPVRRGPRERLGRAARREHVRGAAGRAGRRLEPAAVPERGRRTEAALSREPRNRPAPAR
jgi:hypothetical protein